MSEHDKISANNAAFIRRLKEINRSPQGRDALKSITTAKDYLREQYRLAALAHWKERGNDASTGYGCVPEGRYQKKLNPSDCAKELADKMVDYAAADPSDPC
ncbi:MAG TPA: hypothetical protein VFX97_16960 [Pyrinomonadaceae bacterium]|nr:hypothetical protein [Pyrinomonadaceae bacterium]